MSETRACGECRGAGWAATTDGRFEPCKVCQGTGRVWSVDLLRDGECGACPETLETCSAPALKDEPPW